MFIKELHLYLDDNGNCIPSVSQIIEAVGGNSFEFVNKEVLQYAAERGKRVHTATELLDKDLTPIIDDEIATYVLGFKSLDLPRWVDIEKSFQNNRIHPYCGTADRISDEAVYDIKTCASKNISKWTVQLTAYAYALKRKRIHIIWLRKDGKAEIIDLDYDPLLWESCLNVFYAFHFKKWETKMKKALKELQLEEII